MKIGNDVALDAYVLHVEGNAGGGDGVESRGVVHEVGGEGAIGNLLLGQITGELVEDGRYHFQVGQLLRPRQGIGNVPVGGILRVQMPWILRSSM